ncbi:hypothetical protein KXW29_005989 [Aspergillus fumigatus]|uniref:Uncharacterized protein n=1 Tax=Aspergillus fumigatus TaxID=746128 RepID=A0A229Y508_ASPFM|nr:hypothetical protein KXX32_007515 [Aspergillus fumigatus]KAH1893037.1 hypothetical protein KXV57_003457 [Aspergillus fumigatus]KAH2267528.1 hypothetical protein KXW02_003044 [Aspergillus fumigatus]KAH2651695.1 hypothetical protein KXV32_004286 [Aspergillus fumigatus]KAH2710746.1 hypothetical protein KXW29_005989 [Aspergillus fumigatus]
MSLEVQVVNSSGRASLDLSLEVSQKDVLEAIESDGWVILQRATDINSSERAKSNKYVAAILRSARDGKFEPSRPRHWPYPSLISAPMLRIPNWKSVSKEKELLAITCYHLGGAETVKWLWEYDKGLSGPETNDTQIVEARGRDIIICNGWLAQRFPKPDEEMDMIMVQYRWTGFNWD